MSVTQQRGFTLIELMIVVAIVSILGAIAYPSYLEHVRKSRRVDAKISLQELTQRQEAYFVRNYSYANTLSALGYSGTSMDSKDGYYSLTIATVTPSTCNGTRSASCSGYTVQALPKAGKTQAKDKQCAVFTLDHIGGKTASDGATSPANTTETCW
ncbi:MAG: type IV pilin protein [Thiolinea sp.]